MSFGYCFGCEAGETAVGKSMYGCAYVVFDRANSTLNFWNMLLWRCNMKINWSKRIDETFKLSISVHVLDGKNTSMIFLDDGLQGFF